MRLLQELRSLLLEANLVNPEVITQELDSILTDRAQAMGERATIISKYVRSNVANYVKNTDTFYGSMKVNQLPQPVPDWVKKKYRPSEYVDVVRVDALRRFINDQLSHAIDFLASPAAPVDPSRMSVPELLQAVVRWDAAGVKKGAQAAEDGVEVVKTYDDGFFWVRVFGKESLIREGSRMGHCVGSYYDRVKDMSCTIYSLRDPKNEPHCTVEEVRGTLEQIKGKQNRAVVPKYVHYILNLLNEGVSGGRKLVASERELEINGYAYNIAGDIVTVGEALAEQLRDTLGDFLKRTRELEPHRFGQVVDGYQLLYFPNLYRSDDRVTQRITKAIGEKLQLFGAHVYIILKDDDIVGGYTQHNRRGDAARLEQFESLLRKNQQDIPEIFGSTDDAWLFGWGENLMGTPYSVRERAFLDSDEYLAALVRKCVPVKVAKSPSEWRFIPKGLSGDGDSQRVGDYKHRRILANMGQITMTTRITQLEAQGDATTRFGYYVALDGKQVKYTVAVDTVGQTLNIVDAIGWNNAPLADDARDDIMQLVGKLMSGSRTVAFKDKCAWMKTIVGSGEGGETVAATLTPNFDAEGIKIYRPKNLAEAELVMPKIGKARIAAAKAGNLIIAAQANGDVVAVINVEDDVITAMDLSKQASDEAAIVKALYVVYEKQIFGRLYTNNATQKTKFGHLINGVFLKRDGREIPGGFTVNGNLFMNGITGNCPANITVTDTLVVSGMGTNAAINKNIRARVIVALGADVGNVNPAKCKCDVLLSDTYYSALVGFINEHSYGRFPIQKYVDKCRVQPDKGIFVKFVTGDTMTVYSQRVAPPQLTDYTDYKY